MKGILRKRRTEEERKRRHLYGDKGARFSARLYYVATDGCSNTITRVVKDNYLYEEFED